MGCSDSSIQNHLSIPTKNVVLANPHQFPKEEVAHEQRNQILILQSILKQTKLNKQKSGYFIQFQNSYQYLEQLYSVCSGNLQVFFNELQQKISDIYMSISKQTLQQMNQNFLINNQSKIQISQEILWFNLNILKVVSRKNEHKFNPTIFKQINKLQKNLVGYLKMKYPRGTQSFVPGDLMSVFKEFDISEDIKFDILKNSNTYFGNQDQQVLSKDIKVFLNKIISELDNYYPKFQKVMQQQVFLVKGQDGEKKSLNYKIGRKIPQNVQKYTDMESNTLEITSPQVFRVIIKWMMYLQEMLIAPNQNINKKKNFKCLIQQDYAGNRIFDEINQDQYFDMINFELIQKIENQKESYTSSNSSLLLDMDKFNSHLLKLLDTSVRKQKFVPLKEMEIIKYSNLNAKFIAWVLAEKLMLAIKKLIKVGKSFYNTKAMINLDLITFKVADLMRGMVTGSKKQILQVYDNLKNLQKQGIIKILRIKNRFGTSLNDAMINFCLTSSFLVCELQLILTDGSQKTNQKYKNVQILNHFFYQLERSPYGILSEIAVLLAYKDSKVSYENSITFQTNIVQIQKCENSHRQNVVQVKQQNKPFICTKCTKFYFKFQNIFLMKHCSVCNIFICGNCIFQQNKELESSMINRQICLQIDKSIAKTLTRLRNIQTSSSASSILKAFSSPYKVLSELFGPRKVLISKLKDYLNSKAKNPEDNLYFIIVKFRTGRAVFKCLMYKKDLKQIQNPINSFDKFLDKQYLHYSNYDLLIFFQPAFNQELSFNYDDSLLYLFSPEQEIKKMKQINQYLWINSLKIGDFKLVIGLQTKNIQLKQTQNVQNTKKRIERTFKYQSIHQITANLPDLAGAKSILKLGQLGIQDKHLQFFKQITWSLDIKELKLNKNNLCDISIVLEKCLSIQRLYVNENWIKKLNFTHELSKIQIINASDNIIEIVKGFQKIKNISKFLLDKNDIIQFPQTEFNNLMILSLKSSRIENFDTIFKSKFPNIQQLYLDYQQNNLRCYQRDGSQEKRIEVVFPKLKSLNFQGICSDIVFLSSKIERIDLISNGLKQVEITNFDNLKYLNLSQNLISSMDFLFSQKFNFENNAICEINLSHNLLENIPIIRSVSLIKLRLQENKINSIQNMTYSTLPFIQYIDLSSNQIQIINQLPLPKLLSLDLSNNRISSAEQLKDSKLQSLSVLKFSYCNQIQTFPLLSLKNLTQLNLSNIVIDDMSSIQSSTLPFLKNLLILQCNFSIFPNISFSSLQTLNLQNSKVKDLRNLQKSQLPNLRQLILSYLQITEDADVHQDINMIDSNRLVDKDSSHQPGDKKSITDQKKEQKSKYFSCKFNFPKLKSLFLNATNFTTMQGLEQSDLPNLEYLSIQSCYLTKYPELKFKSLKELNAQYSQIQDLNHIVNGLQNLQKLSCQSNSLQNVRITLLKLKSINLCHNKIKKFTQIDQLTQLTELYLRSNQLKQFPIIRANKLTKLEISHNCFEDLLGLQKCSMSLLDSLKIEYSSLSKCPLPIISFNQMKSIVIIYCKLKDISNLSKAKLPLVQDINLCDNQIQKIPTLKLPQLKFLRLNRNNISDISGLQTSQLPQLQIIQLEKNKVNSCPSLNFPNLRKIFLQINQCVDVSGFCKSQIKGLQILNICHNNNLKDFPMLQCNFQQLYANQTMLTDVIRVNQYRNLKKLQLNKNKITSLPQLNQKLLQQIQFQDNQLLDIDQFAKGQYNLCKQFSVKGNKIKRLPTLKMIQLRRAYFNVNQIQNVEDFLKSKLPKIQMISFQTNMIQSISKLQFQTLQEIYLTNNLPLKQVKFLTLEEYPKLRMFVAATTGISFVQVFPKMPMLEKIWLNASKLQSLQWLSDSLQNLPLLSFFAAPKNLIRSLPSFSKGNLSQVYLYQNPISQFDAFVSDGKPKLENYSVFNISLYANTDEQYGQKIKKIQQSGGINFNISRCF